jgi:hypothetical protein
VDLPAPERPTRATVVGFYGLAAASGIFALHDAELDVRDHASASCQ